MVLYNCPRRYIDYFSTKYYYRAKVMSSIRQFFESLGFLEVETPMMNGIAGGASAVPFVTHLNHFDTSLFMRVAPELYLKVRL